MNDYTDDSQKKSEVQKEIAVALGYDGVDAPRVLATGTGHIAEKIIEKAKENKIAIRQDPVLAEALTQLELGQEIPPELYHVVAEILVFVTDTDKLFRKMEGNK